MPKIRVKEIIKIPTGTPRFQETVPALKNAFLAKVSEGKVTHLPQEIVDHGDGYSTITTTSIWNNQNDYNIFKNWVIENYHLAKSEYYYSIGVGHPGKVSQIITETEE